MVEQTEPTLGVCAKCTLFFSFVMAVVVWLVVSDTAAPLPIGMPPPPPRVVQLRLAERARLEARRGRGTMLAAQHHAAPVRHEILQRSRMVADAAADPNSMFDMSNP